MQSTVSQRLSSWGELLVVHPKTSSSAASLGSAAWALGPAGRPRPAPCPLWSPPVKWVSRRLQSGFREMMSVCLLAAPSSRGAVIPVSLLCCSPPCVGPTTPSSARRGMAGRGAARAAGKPEAPEAASLLWGQHGPRCRVLRRAVGSAAVRKKSGPKWKLLRAPWELARSWGTVPRLPPTPCSS